METELQIGQKVSMIPGMEDAYEDKDMPAGLIGTVREIKTDDYGFHMIFVEWDKDSPNYNGTRDMWTYANHFNPEGDVFNAIENPDQIKEKVTEREHSKGVDDDIIDKYLECVNHAVEMLYNSDGFILLSTEYIDQGGSILVNVETEGGATTKPALIALDTKLVEIAAGAYQNLIGIHLGSDEED